MNHSAPGATHLLRRRNLKPDEWPEGYLAALVRLNGVRKPLAYDLERIRTVLPWNRAGDQGALCIDRRMGQGAGGRPQYGALPLPRWASLHRMTPIRYCPHCLADDRYIRSRWRIPQLLVCTKHGCYLKDDLAEQCLTFRLQRGNVRFLSDVSNQDVLDAAVCCLPDEFQIVSSVWGPLERAAESSEQPYTDDTVGELAAWTLLAWRLLTMVAQAHVFWVQRSPSMGTLANVANLVVALGVTVTPSREGVRTFLGSLRENAHYKAALRCLRVLMAKDAKENSVLSKLPLMELHDHLVAAAPQMAVVTKPGEMAFRDERARGLSRRQVRQLLGINDKLLGQWIRAQWFPNIVIRKIGMKRYIFVDREDVRRVQRYLLSLISVEDFVDAHAVDWATYLALRSECVLQPIRIGDRRHVRRSELSALMSRLEQASAPLPHTATTDHALFSQQLVTLAGRQGTYGAFVKAAIAAEFPVYRDRDRPGLSSFRVGAEALVWLKERRLAERARRRSASNHTQLDLMADAA